MPSRCNTSQNMHNISQKENSSSDESSSDQDDETGGEDISQPETPSKNAKKFIQNPFFQNEPSDISSDSESEFDSGSDCESEDEKDKNIDSIVPDADEDPLIKALKAAKERKNIKDRNSPPDLRFSNEVMDISFHPDNNLVGVSLIDGQIDIFGYTNEENTLKKRLKIHKFSVRTLEFDTSGHRIFSGSGGTGDSGTLKITDVETSQVVFKAVKCHPSPLYKIKPMTEHLFASGDEDGTVKLWDSRKKPNSGVTGSYGQVMEAKPFEEFVSDIYFNPNVDEGRRMVVSSGEGTLESFNVRGKRPDLQSEQYGGELTSLDSVHRNSKLVAGCGDGKLYMFNWGEFGYHSAEFPGHPDSINAIVTVTDNVIVTACEDGAIRAVHLYPHRFLGTVGHHHGDSGRPVDFPIEKLDVCGSGDIIASTSHDQRVKFWNISYLEKMEYQKTKKPYLQPKKIGKGTKTRRKDAKMLQAREIEHQLPSSKRGNRKEFFKGMDQ